MAATQNPVVDCIVKGNDADNAIGKITTGEDLKTKFIKARAER